MGSRKDKYFPATMESWRQPWRSGISWTSADGRLPDEATFVQQLLRQPPTEKDARNASTVVETATADSPRTTRSPGLRPASALRRVWMAHSQSSLLDGVWTDNWEHQQTSRSSPAVSPPGSYASSDDSEHVRGSKLARKVSFGVSISEGRLDTLLRSVQGTEDAVHESGADDLVQKDAINSPVGRYHGLAIGCHNKADVAFVEAAHQLEEEQAEQAEQEAEWSIEKVPAAKQRYVRRPATAPANALKRRSNSSLLISKRTHESYQALAEEPGGMLSLAPPSAKGSVSKWQPLGTRPDVEIGRAHV